MIWIFLLALVLLAAAGVLLVSGIAERLIGRIVGGVFVALLAVGVGAWSFTYVQTTGEAKVVKTFTGTVEPATLSTGLHPRAPWDTVYTYPTLNNVASFVADGEKGHDGVDPTGPQITVNDKDGVSANVDVQVTYSIAPEKVDKIHAELRDPDLFVKRVVNVAIRDGTRIAPGSFTTIEMLTKRGEVATAIYEALHKKLEPKGVIVDGVSVQDIRYPAAVTERFAAAQAAATEVVKAEQDAEVVRIQAQGKKDAAIKIAEGEAQANRLISKSLTPEVLEQRRIDALNKASTVYVVPDGSTPMVGVTGATAK